MLAENGTRAGRPYVKHLDDEIWELRPLADRILFAAWVEDKIILLHHFVKKTQKTPPQEIKQAKRNLKAFLGRTDAVINEIIKAREENGLSQRQLEKISGVKQAVIARMEKGTSTPQLETILRILAPLGKTLKVVPIEPATASV